MYIYLAHKSPSLHSRPLDSEDVTVISRESVHPTVYDTYLCVCVCVLLCLYAYRQYIYK